MYTPEASGFLVGGERWRAHGAGSVPGAAGLSQFPGRRLRGACCPPSALLSLPQPQPLQGMGTATPLGLSYRIFLLDVSMGQHFPSHYAALSPVAKWTPSPAPALGRGDVLSVPQQTRGPRDSYLEQAFHSQGLDRPTSQEEAASGRIFKEMMDGG